MEDVILRYVIEPKCFIALIKMDSTLSFKKLQFWTVLKFFCLFYFQPEEGTTLEEWSNIIVIIGDSYKLLGIDILKYTVFKILLYCLY